MYKISNLKGKNTRLVYCPWACHSLTVCQAYVGALVVSKVQVVPGWQLAVLTRRYHPQSSPSQGFLHPRWDSDAGGAVDVHEVSILVFKVEIFLSVHTFNILSSSPEWMIGPSRSLVTFT